MNITDSVGELINFARQHSRYYRQHFAEVPGQVALLTELPTVDPDEFWRNSETLDLWPVLTNSAQGALVFRTGGSTSAGKLSVYTREEWRRLVGDFGNALSAQFNPGDRVANLFFAGDLYASFLFIHDSLAHVCVDITEFPFTGDIDSQVLAQSIQQHRINVLAGLPAHLLTFAAWLERREQTLPVVDTLLYGGESLFDSQRQLLNLAFPNARIASIGYASVDAGFIGSSQRDCAEGEHRMHENHAFLEIVDEYSGEVIESCDEVGLLVLTNLHRRLMPLIRYPVGDRACWREPHGTAQRKFALKGRSASSQRVRVGILSLVPQEIAELIRRDAASDDWQMVIEQATFKDVLTLKWVPAAQSPDRADVNQQLENAMLELYPLITQLRTDHLLELHVQCCTHEDLPRHPRSGKCLRVLDLRRYEHKDQEGPDATADSA
ncbi:MULTISPECIES: phenylacetate--CoA ligase family protein [unclassified Pseudomonas]|uniref:phenylacetate--CoA ligase family protein n=1 Tax=unclassified Pseudomonas TaxID=196821 RepID=UPI001B338D90|nr:phenylacetate--CoA ligase family protein [Pseudomonas sp. P116]MBP5946810.1 phenylacetate--CoA ligase family protein [Pseudomonas sp. P9(2020)]MBZ9564948.1 phenylacetate--CoA ligase family protein [Pseudomonas sp. P116]